MKNFKNLLKSIEGLLYHKFEYVECDNDTGYYQVLGCNVKIYLKDNRWIYEVINGPSIIIDEYYGDNDEIQKFINERLVQ